MDTRIQVGSLLESWELVEAARAAEGDRRAAMPPKEGARAMATALRDPANARRILEALRAGAFGGIVPRSLGTDHVGAEFLRAVESGRVLVIANGKRRASGIAADTSVVTSDNGKQLEDTKIVAHALHGRDADVHVVQNARELVAHLRGFDSIRRLVFMFHGSPGEMKIGEDQQSLSELAKGLRKANATPRCTELFFEGCHVGSGGLEIAALMDTLQADQAQGYAAFHGWGALSFQTYKGDTADQLEGDRRYRRLKRFIVSGQPTGAEMVHRPGLYKLGVEYFSTLQVGNDILDRGLSGQLERLNDRTQLRHESFSIENADRARQFDTIVGSMTIVTIRR
jgi:hypothetical protein